MGQLWAQAAGPHRSWQMGEKPVKGIWEDTNSIHSYGLMEQAPNFVLAARSAYSSLIPLWIHVWVGFLWARAMDSKTLVPWEVASKSRKKLFINTDAQAPLSDVGIQEIWEEILESALNITTIKKKHKKKKKERKPFLIA